MAITVECAGCSKKYRVADDKAGAIIRCKDCGEKIRIPDEDEDFEAAEERPVRRKTGAAAKKKKKSGNSVGLIIGLVGGGLALLLMLGGIAVWMLARGKPVAPMAAPAIPGVNPSSANPGNPQPGVSASTGNAWNVIADPPRSVVTWPAEPPKLDGFRGTISELKFTTALTPFVVTGTVGTGDYMRIWNLSTGEVIGQFDRPRPQFSSTKSATR